MGRPVCRLWDCGGVCPLEGEAAPEAWAGFLQGRAWAQEILELLLCTGK